MKIKVTTPDKKTLYVGAYGAFVSKEKNAASFDERNKAQRWIDSFQRMSVGFTFKII